MKIYDKFRATDMGWLSPDCIQKTLAPVALILFCSLCVVSCGGGGGSSATTTTPNPVPADAVSDGVGDAQDNYPSTPAGIAADAQGCSAPQLDVDSDSVNSTADACVIPQLLAFSIEVN